MSETKSTYERTENGDWFMVHGDVRMQITSIMIELSLETGYQLGLQSHPAPTPDLLTDNPWDESNITQRTPNLVFFKSGRFVHPDEVISLHSAYEDGKKAQLSKLQQARPTTEAREQIAEQIAIGFYNKEVSESGSNINWEGYKDLYMEMAYPIADQILLLFPDEQAIEKRTRQEIAVALEKKEWFGKKLTPNERVKCLEWVKSGQMPEDK